MIVTCESCKSRYKLDDAKITGRGAKITCPKCKTVFVVYAKDQNEVTRPTPPAGTPPVAAPPPSGGLADAVRAVDRKAAPPGVAVAGPGSAPTPPLGTPAATEDWEDEPTRVDDGGGHEVVRGRPGASASPATSSSSASGSASGAAATSATSSASAASSGAAASPAAANGGPPSPGGGRDEIAARAASLDFRKVGVTTWKVKVKIGLIYDFSDIKTLRKYIQDGRVTPTDVVSWDGKSWRAIGDIPDLDAYFVETWEMLAARKDDPSSATLAPAPPTPEVAKAIEETRTPTPLRSGGEPNQFADPFEESRRKAREKAELKRTAPVVPPVKPPEPPAAKSRMPAFALLLLLLLAVVAGSAWWMQQDATPPQVNRPAGAAAPTGSTQDIREQINQDLEEALRANPSADATAPPPTEGAAAAQPPPDRTPVVRNGVPEGARPVVPKNPNTAVASVKQAETSAADHEAVGDDAAAGGDWATAAQAYQKAVSLDGRSPRLVGKLGHAQLQAGDAAAQATLQKAAQMGVKDAHKHLGDLAARNGDAAGAVGHYQTYLQGSPRDAQEIQKKISQLSGG